MAFSAAQLCLKFSSVCRSCWIKHLVVTCLINCLHRPGKKPLSPSCTVQISDTKDSPMPVPLLAAALGAETRTVVLAYGNHLQPVIEREVSLTGSCSMSRYYTAGMMEPRPHVQQWRPQKHQGQCVRSASSHCSCHRLQRRRTELDRTLFCSISDSHYKSEDITSPVCK